MKGEKMKFKIEKTKVVKKEVNVTLEKDEDGIWLKIDDYYVFGITLEGKGVLVDYVNEERTELQIDDKGRIILEEE